MFLIAIQATVGGSIALTLPLPKQRDIKWLLSSSSLHAVFRSYSFFLVSINGKILYMRDIIVR